MVSVTKKARHRHSLYLESTVDNVESLLLWWVFSHWCPQYAWAVGLDRICACVGEAYQLSLQTHTTFCIQEGFYLWLRVLPTVMKSRRPKGSIKKPTANLFTFNNSILFHVISVLGELLAPARGFLWGKGQPDCPHHPFCSLQLHWTGQRKKELWFCIIPSILKPWYLWNNGCGEQWDGAMYQILIDFIITSVFLIVHCHLMLKVQPSTHTPVHTHILLKYFKVAEWIKQPWSVSLTLDKSNHWH